MAICNLVLLIIAVTYTYGLNTTDCLNCMKTPSMKGCRSDISSSSTFQCCDSNDFSVNCGAATRGACSDDTDYLVPDGSKLLLCPQDQTACGAQELSLYDKYSVASASSNYIPKDGLCWYKIYMGNYGFDGITLKDISFYSSDVVIYRMRKYMRYEYVQYIYSYNEYKIPMDSYDYLMILVTPTSKSQIGTFQLNASLYQNKGISGGAIAGIVIGSVAFVVIILSIIICCIVKHKKKKRQQILIKNQAQKMHQPMNQMQNQEEYQKLRHEQFVRPPIINNSNDNNSPERLNAKLL